MFSITATWRTQGSRKRKEKHTRKATLIGVFNFSKHTMKQSNVCSSYKILKPRQKKAIVLSNATESLSVLGLSGIKLCEFVWPR